MELIDIKTPEDIESFTVVTRYIDDDLECAECIINGIEIEFLWRGDLSFLDDWEEEEDSFERLIECIKETLEEGNTVLV